MMMMMSLCWCWGRGGGPKFGETPWYNTWTLHYSLFSCSWIQFSALGQDFDLRLKFWPKLNSSLINNKNYRYSFWYVNIYNIIKKIIMIKVWIMARGHRGSLMVSAAKVKAKYQAPPVEKVITVKCFKRKFFQLMMTSLISIWQLST